MKEKTTAYFDRSVTDYLHSKGINCTEIANEALLKVAVEQGYENIAEKLGYHERKVAGLRKMLKSKRATETHQTNFYTMFRGYLVAPTAPGTLRTMDAIRGWLLGPGNREYADIIGHPTHLTTEKIKDLMARAHTYKGEK